MESNHERRQIKPVRPAAPYIGGKRNLADRLVRIIAGIPHRTYAEPFVGMGGVFFRRTDQPRAEVINDISRDVTNLFRILNRHYPQFLDALKYQITGRDEFERLKAAVPDTLTEFERAARFLYLQRLSFGGKVASRTFGIDPGAPARFDLTKLVPMLDDLHARLAGVVIENRPWPVFIRQYDRPGTLFYLDPPYWGCETDYGDGIFARADFQAMADLLSTIKGRFLLSINDVPEIQRIFDGFKIEAVKTTYTIGGGKKAKPAGELIISN